MNTLQNADTFFYITSIAVIMVSILVIILLVYVVKIVQTISQIANTIRRESEHVAEDIAELRDKVKQETMKVGAFWQFVTGFFLNKFADKMTSSAGNRSQHSKSRRKTKTTRTQESDEGSDEAQEE